MIYLLSGLHSARFSANLLATLRLFLADDVRAVVVLQKGLELPEIPGVTLLRSEPGLMPFLDAGMAWLRANTEPGDWFARVDCDDLYSEDYLRSVRNAIDSGADWMCIPSQYLRHGDSLIYCQHLDPEAAGGLGGSLASRIDRAFDWRLPPGMRHGEDTLFCQDMPRETAYLAPPMGHALQRHEGHEHTFPVPTYLLAQAYPCTPYLQPGPAEEAITRPPVLDSPIEQDVELACSIRHYLTTPTEEEEERLSQ